MRKKCQQRIRPRGFTILEILLVVGVVMLLLSILIVAMGQAVRGAQSANTQVLMVSMKQGLIQFREDVGYYPPVLDADRGLLNPPDPDSGSYASDMQDWWSVTTLADHLIGYGDVGEDAYDGLGIRTPGRDGVWGATIYSGASGGLVDRNGGAGAAPTGPVLGGYWPAAC